MVLIFLSTMNYLTDSYLIYAASVLASNSVIRSLFGFAFPLFTPNMYSIGGKNGIHWGPAIGGLLALICLPFPFIFFKYGAGIRERCKYASEAKALLEEMQASSKKNAQANPDEDDDLEKATGLNLVVSRRTSMRKASQQLLVAAPSSTSLPWPTRLILGHCPSRRGLRIITETLLAFPAHRARQRSPHSIHTQNNLTPE